MKSVIYNAFSQKEAKEFDVQHTGAQRAEAFVRAFLKRSMPHMSQQVREDLLQRKAVVLEYFTHRKQKEKKKKSRGLSAKQRRELRLFDIKPEQQRYSLFLPLHELWKQYIRDLCNGLKPDTQPQMIQAKLLKADLHGAIVSGNLLRSSSSGCPSHHSAATPYHVDIPPLPALRVGDDCSCNQFSPLVGHFKWPLCTFSTQRSQLASQRAQHHPQPGSLNWSPWFYMSAVE
uniref:POP4 homolog, ribonuclease P/MRP subunit n=1 Tax=Sus scrofa TaxID=9823 RepID=A0A8D1CLW8_PIG